MLRVAAAVILLAGAGTFLLLGDGNNTTGTDVAVVTPIITPVQTLPAERIPQNVQPETKNTTATETTAPVNTKAVAKSSKKEIPKRTFSKPHTTPDVQEAPAPEQLAVAKKTDVRNPDAEVTKSDYQATFNNPVVTSEKASAYVPVEAAAVTQVPVDDAVATGGERNGGLKGFLRKATRTLERRTGIKAVNDDDELLIGAVALKLK
jgi:hypothetical protein